jgi:hypothetical protein
VRAAAGAVADGKLIHEKLDEREPSAAFRPGVGELRIAREAAAFVEDVQHGIGLAAVEANLDLSTGVAHDVAQQFAEDQLRVEYRIVGIAQREERGGDGVAHATSLERVRGVERPGQLGGLVGIRVFVGGDGGLASSSVSPPIVPTKSPGPTPGGAANAGGA